VDRQGRSQSPVYIYRLRAADSAGQSGGDHAHADGYFSEHQYSGGRRRLAVHGVITARNTDVGALINSGASTPGQELFHLAAINTLRVFVAVPQLYSQAVRPGASASLTLDEFPGKSFAGTIARNSNSIDPASRTLNVEVDVDNRNGTLLPGAYVRVHFKLPQSVASVTIPVNTLLFRSEGLRVGVVRNGRAELVPITIGRDYGNSVEVVSGLQPTDPVIVNPSDSLISGAIVRITAQTVQGRPPL